jgi:hypothetical protein
MKKAIALVLLLSFGAAQAALVDRGGGFIYDNVLDITWLQDANYAQTSGYHASGGMTKNEAVAWAEGLSVYDTVRDVTWDDWRLPTTLQPDPSCSRQSSISNISTEYNCTGSEMGHLFNVDGVNYIDGGHGFTNIVNADYWSGTEFPNFTDGAYTFQFYGGRQSYAPGYVQGYALAVRDGDVVPIPAAVYLFASGLGLLGWIRRRKTA